MEAMRLIGDEQRSAKSLIGELTKSREIRISCNKKAKSICRTRRRNLITRKSLVSSLLQVVHQKFSSHLQIHEFGLLTVLIWFTSLKKTTRILYAMRKIQKHVLIKTKLLTIGGH
nr:hypothetical protein CFP56_12823 [Quercus suber]